MKLKEIVRLFITIGMVTAVILGINYALGYRVKDIHDILQIVLIVSLYSIGNTVGIMLSIKWTNNFFPPENNLKLNTMINLITTIFVNFLVVCFTNYVIFSIYKKLDFSISYDKENFTYWYVIPLFLSIIVSLIITIISFYRSQIQTETKKREQIIQKVSTQYENLQKQLSPHFLFNSLNVLDALIEENPESAQEFTQELSHLYRYVLEQENNTFTSIEEELKFIKSYLFLMEKRFENSVEIYIDEKIDKSRNIFPLSLQLLLENAFKHNALSEQNPLKIKIYQKENTLIVENNLLPKSKISTSTRKGLTNIQARYQKLGLKIFVEKTKEKFMVKLPLITQNQKIMKYTPEQIKKAEQRVKELKKFYKNLASYIFTCLICASINLFLSWNEIIVKHNFWNFWAFWVIVPWGLVILRNAIVLFVLPGKYSFDWEEKQLNKILEKNKKV